MNKDKLLEGLNQFTGTQEWVNWSILFPNMYLTDGAKFLAENADCYWLMDAIASHQPTAMKDPMLQDMQFWTLKVREDRSATLICERDSDDVAITQEIEYTDFPLGGIKLYVGLLSVGPLGEDKYTILLPSEY